MYKKQPETKTSPYAWRSHVDEHTAFHPGYAVPAQIFLGGNVLITIIIYSEDVLNFLSQIVKCFEYHWKTWETENCRENWHSATTCRSNLIVIEGEY